MSELKSVTLKTLVENGTVRAISKLKVNTNGYPFVTFLNKNSESQNVYFGQKTASLVMDNFSKEDNILVFLKNANINQVENEAGEIRYKLSTSGVSKYSSTAELMEIFGVEEKTQDFNMELFAKEFTPKTALVPTED